jgi:hypothetical protein
MDGFRRTINDVGARALYYLCEGDNDHGDCRCYAEAGCLRSCFRQIVEFTGQRDLEYVYYFCPTAPRA